MMGAPRPLDFSIAAGRIGAVQRRGADASAAAREAGPVTPVHVDGLVVTVVGCGDKYTFGVPAEATLVQLHQAIAERHPGAAASHRVIAGGKVLSSSLVEHGAPVRVRGGADGEGDVGDAGERALSSWGLAKGDKIKVVVSLQDDVEALKAEASREASSFNGYRSFKEEEERQQRRCHGAPVFARKTSGSISDMRYGFRRIEPLQIDPTTNQPYTQPPPEEARKLLQRLADDFGIQAIMKKYEWSVGLLTELAPSLETGLIGVCDQCLLGLNKNKGEEILLRLRTSDCKSFRPYLSIRETLVHELTHCRYGDHDDKFWGLFRVLMRESKELDWSAGTAHRTHEAGAGAGVLEGEKQEFVLGGAAVEGQGVFDTAAERAAVAAQLRSFSAAKTGPGSAAGKGDVGKGACCGATHAGALAERKHAESKAAVDSVVQGVHEGGAARHVNGVADGVTASSLSVDENPMSAGGGECGGAEMEGGGGVKGAHDQEEMDTERKDGEDKLQGLLAMGFTQEQASTALSKFHGSAERAADWLFSGAADCDAAPEPSATTAPAAVSPPPQPAPEASGEEGAQVDAGQWTCSTCTLINATSATVCAVCGSTQPHATVARDGSAEGGPGQGTRGTGRDEQGPKDHTADEQARERVGNALQRLMGQVSSMAVARSALETVLGVLTRIENKPDDAKLRRLRLANPALMEKVGKVEGGYGLLLACGFRYSSDALFVECPPSVSQVDLAICASLVASALEMLP